MNNTHHGQTLTWRILCTSLFLATAGYSVASMAKETNNPYQKTFKIALPNNAHTLYLGGGLSNRLIHGIAEVPTSYGQFYGKIGQFYNGDGVAGQVGYRYPYKFTGTNHNNVYVGAFAGHVKSDRKNGKRFNRLGGGFDIGYMWFDQSRLGTVSLGIFLPLPEEENDGTELSGDPELMLSFSLAAGFF